MSIKSRILLVALAAFALTAAFAACSGGPTTTDIVETAKAQNKIDNATATAVAVIAAGGDPDKVEVEVGTGSAAEKANQEQAATATAQAEAGIVKQSVGGAATDKQAEGAAFEVTVPDGPAESGVIDVQIPSLGADGVIFDPDVIKITAGSTVRWLNDRRSASSSTSHPGQDEQWDSGAISKGPFDKEPKAFEHTFTIPGCYTYESQFSGDTATGAVCVE